MKQLKCPITDKWIKNLRSNNEVLCNTNKEQIHAVCSNINETGDYNVEWNQSEWKEQIQEDISYVVALEDLQQDGNKIQNITREFIYTVDLRTETGANGEQGYFRERDEYTGDKSMVLKSMRNHY